MWDEVVSRIKDLVLADGVLSGIYGERFRKAGTGEQQVPGLEWTLVGDTEGELWAPCIIQFSQWTANAAEVRQSEFRLRSLFHRDLPFLLGGDVLVFSAYLDGADLATPDRSNILGRAIRFRITPLRRQYALP